MGRESQLTLCGMMLTIPAVIKQIIIVTHIAPMSILYQNVFRPVCQVLGSLRGSLWVQSCVMCLPGFYCLHVRLVWPYTRQSALRLEFKYASLTKAAIQQLLWITGYLIRSNWSRTHEERGGDTHEIFSLICECDIQNTVTYRVEVCLMFQYLCACVSVPVCL